MGRRPVRLSRRGRTPAARRGVARRIAGSVLRTCVGLMVLAGLAIGGLAVLLWRGPIAFERLTERVAQGLETQFGHGFDVEVQSASVGWDASGPNLGISGVTIRDSKGNVVVSAPQAVVAFDPWTLGSGKLVPRDISFVGLSVALTIAPDGSVAVSAAGPLPPRTTPVRTRPQDASFGPGAILDALLASDGPVAVLERAGVRDGNLRIDDRRRGAVTDYTDLALT